MWPEEHLKLPLCLGDKRTTPPLLKFLQSTLGIMRYLLNPMLKTEKIKYYAITKVYLQQLHHGRLNAFKKFAIPIVHHN